MGTTFLVYTVSVTELILNAVALGIILDIDDLLFDALATTPGRHLVHQLDPLPMPSMPRIRGADAKSVFMSVFIPGLTILVYYFMLEPFVGTLTQVKTAMCGGNQNFVWSTDKRRITHLSPTFGGGWEEEEESLKKLGRWRWQSFFGSLFFGLQTRYDEIHLCVETTFMCRKGQVCAPKPCNYDRRSNSKRKKRCCISLYHEVHLKTDIFRFWWKKNQEF